MTKPRSGSERYGASMNSGDRCCYSGLPRPQHSVINHGAVSNWLNDSASSTSLYSVQHHRHHFERLDCGVMVVYTPHAATQGNAWEALLPIRLVEFRSDTGLLNSDEFE